MDATQALSAIADLTMQLRQAMASAQELKSIVHPGVAEAEETAAQAGPAWWRSDTEAQPGTASFAMTEALSGRGCLGRSQPDEPVFVLCARDRAASMIVREWAQLVDKMGGSEAKTFDARRIADDMERWRSAHGGGKLPD